MNTKIGVGILAALIVIGGIYLATRKPKEAAIEGAQAQAGKVAPNWKFTSAGMDQASGADRTRVTLTLGDKTYDAGTYNGSCAEIGASGGVDGKGLLAGELSGVQCWFAGGGDEIGLFAEEDGAMTIMHGELDEPNGEGSPGMRGNFKALISLKAL